MGEVEMDSEEMQRCLDDCHECQRECLETAHYCLERGGKLAEAEVVPLLLACAEICRTSVTFLALESDLHTEVCAACAVVCEECADTCEAFADDDQLSGCAEVCRSCAESCEEMSASAGATAKDEDE
jgi:hypothetical protein